MHTVHSWVTTAQLADAIGVSDSSVKRWIDAGRIAASRTAGGHRRVPVEEAVRYIRSSGAEVVRPGRLGLVAGEPNLSPGDFDDALHAHLIAGRAAEASGLLEMRFLAGASVAEIADGPLRRAMVRVGERWRRHPAGIFEEHRATEIAVSAMIRLRALLAPAPDAPVAIGGAPSGDPYVLPSLAAAATLEDAGMRSVNLGPGTPLETIAIGAASLRPTLVWLSASVAGNPRALGRRILGLAEEARGLGAVLVVGGASLDRLALSPAAALHAGRSMTELRALARGLLLAAGATVRGSA